MKRFFSLLMIFVVCTRVLFAGCCDENIKAGVANYKAGEYNYALRCFTAALECPDATDADKEYCRNYINKIKDKLNSSVSTFTPSIPVEPTINVIKVSADKQFKVGKVAFRLKPVEGGDFIMGASQSRGDDCESDELPGHKVLIQSFYMGQFEVTQELWEEIMGDNPSLFNGENLPVENVSWDNCQTFIKRLNERTGAKFRLPTEAEWEYAARGGKKSKGYKYSGGNDLSAVAWYKSNSSGTTHAVGQKTANELGLYDMSGNVWEWCQDWYGKYNSLVKLNPEGVSSGNYRVHRGGSWLMTELYCPVSFRYCDAPDCTYSQLGFRLCLDAK